MISPERVRPLLQERFGGDVGKLEPLAGGAFSRAFAFSAGGRGYVVRVSEVGHAAEAFAKDDRAGRLFASPTLPIPCVVARGEWEIGQFAVSERVPGRRVAELPAEGQRALLPALLDTLEAIGRADVAGSTGYGGWDAEGRGEHATWHAFLAHAIENRSEGFYRDWHAFFETTFLERDFYEHVYRRMMDLAVDCPEERALIHNDYHFDNVLSDGARVTGVVDWGNACYGDPLYDAAWVRWVFAKDYGIDALPPLRERHGQLPNFAERVACYTYHVGLDDMRYFARIGRGDLYADARGRLLALLEAES